MVHSPTDDLFSSQQWEHWAMLFILVLGLVVGYGQAAAEDRRRAQRRRGGPQAPAQGRRRRSRRKPPVESRRPPSPQQMQAIAPKLQRNPKRNPRAQSTPRQKAPPIHSQSPHVTGRRPVASPQRHANRPLHFPRP